MVSQISLPLSLKAMRYPCLSKRFFVLLPEILTKNNALKLMAAFQSITEELKDKDIAITELAREKNNL